MEENNPGLTLSKKTVIFSNGRMKSRVARSSKLQSLFFEAGACIKSCPTRLYDTKQEREKKWQTPSNGVVQDFSLTGAQC